MKKLENCRGVYICSHCSEWFNLSEMKQIEGINYCVNCVKRLEDIFKYKDFISEIKIVINEIPPSNNKFQGTGNRYAYQNIKKYWAELIFCEVIKQKIPRKKIKKSVVILKHFFKTKATRDPDNYSGKFVMDGLVNAGVIEDDSFNNVKLEIEGYCDKENPRIEIIIKIKEVK